MTRSTSAPVVANATTTIASYAEVAGQDVIQHLRQLVRNAQKVQAEGKSSKASREIFRYLKELQEETQKQIT